MSKLISMTTIIKNNTISSTILNFPSSYSYLAWDLILRLIVLAIGILTNIVNISVFLNSKLKDISYKYMLVNSSTNLAYLAISLAGVFTYNCTYCPSSQTYPAGIFSIYFIFYVSSCLAIFRILVEIAISVRTFLILINRNFNRLNYKQILLTLFIISMAYYFQQPFIYDVIDIWRNGQLFYSIRVNQLGNSSFFKNLVLVQFSVRIFLAVIVLTVINILNVIAFHRKLKNRGVDLFLHFFSEY